MRNLILFFVFLFMSNFLKAEKIKGVILDSSNNKPIEYANIRLISKHDSVFITGSVSDINGKFDLESSYKSNLVLIISSFGYKTKMVELIDANSKDLTILLEINEIELDIITVEAETVYKETVNGTIVMPGKNEIASSQNAVDLLSKVAGLDVDEFSKKISAFGQANTLVLINGVKKQNLSYDYLKHISPELIKRIEISTNPSVKYDGEVDAVINIILKQNNTRTFSISPTLTSSYPNKQSYNEFDIGSEVGDNKFRFFVSGNACYTHSQESNAQKRNFHESINDISTDIYSSESILKNNDFSLFYGFDYFINEKNILNFSGKNTLLVNKSEDTGIAEEFNESSLLNTTATEGAKNTDNQMSNYSLFYKKILNNPDHNLTFDFNYYKLNNNSINNYKYFAIDSNTITNSTLNIENNLTNKYSLVSDIDYVYPFSEKLNFETGYEFYYQNFINSFNDFNNLYYEEFRHSGYLNITKDFSILDIQTGIRYEKSQILFNDTSANNYYNLLPSLSISKQISKKQNIKFKYYRRLSRPVLNQLNPNVTISNIYYTYEGNPFLTPATKDEILLIHTFKTAKLYLRSTIFYSNSFNLINKQIVFENENPLNYKYQNSSTTELFGMNLYSNLKITKFFTLSPLVILCNEWYTKKSNDVVKNIYFAFNLKTEIVLPKDVFILYRLAITGWHLSYYGKYISGQEHLFGVGKKIFKNNGMLILFYQNPEFLLNFYSETENTYKNFDENIRSRENMSFFGLKFTYTYQVGKVKSLRRKLNMEQDAKKNEFDL